MNKNNARGYLPLVQALAEGRVIQSRMFSCDPWKDCARPDFTMDPSNYRIKPEPREIWVNHYPDYQPVAYESKKAADENLNPFLKGVTRHYREVIQ